MRRFETQLATIERELEKKVGNDISVLYLLPEEYEAEIVYAASHIVIYRGVSPDPDDTTDEYVPVESVPFEIPPIPCMEDHDIEAVPAVDRSEPAPAAEGKTFYQVMNEELLEEAELEDD